MLPPTTPYFGAMARRSYSGEAWQRTVIESLRPIDSPAVFWITLTEIDFRDVGGRDPDDFTSEELVTAVDAWLSTLDPDSDPAVWESTGSGVRIGLRARGRSPGVRGWRAQPSLNLLEQIMGDLHLIPGRRRQLISLDLAEVDALAAGTTKVVGQGVSYRETFADMANEMRCFDRTTVAQLPPNAVAAYAGMLGAGGAPAVAGQLRRRLAGDQPPATERLKPPIYPQPG